MEHQHRLPDNRLISTWTIAALWLALTILSSSSILAQNPACRFALGLGSTWYDQGKGVATDANDNIYVIGYFTGTIDFDPGPGTASLTASDSGNIFVARYDSSGKYVWAFRVGGIGTGLLANEGASIALDRSGNVVVRGAFTGTADFDPGPGTVELTATAGTNDMFLAKYSPAGEYLFAFQLPARIRDLAVDSNGNIVVGGSFQGTVDFDPGADTTHLTAVESTPSSPDMFVARYSARGDLVWAFRVGSLALETVNALAIDNNGNIYVTGSFNGPFGIPVNFNPGSGPRADLTAAGGSDMFVAKYDSSAKYLWAFGVGSDGTDQGLAIATDGTTVAVTGHFGGIADFDPGSGITLLTALSTQDIFVAQYNASGRYQWAWGAAPPCGSDCQGGWGTGVAIDRNGDICVIGNFKETTDFDPGPGTANLTSEPVNSFNCFVARYSSSGAYRSAFGVPATSGSYGAGLAIGKSGAIYVTGNFTGSADFDPGAGTYTLASAGFADAFIARYSEGMQPNLSVNESVSRSNSGTAVKIVPNPFTSEFALSYDGVAAPARISIIDMMGRVVETGEIADSNPEIMLGSELVAGAYVVQIIQEDVRRSVLVYKVQ